MGRKSQRPTMTNVRTHTTRRTSASVARHELYMKLTALEIERSRRATERDATMKRLEQIDSRLESIQNEQAEIMQFLGTDPASPSTVRNNSSKPANKRMNLSY